ncbi:hypothetical protein DFH06DRAFT_1154221 [Mycena polygramma]|nr:hypothetical protein DFH06DRAFT_1154221 [Mycena polygramma]
MIPYTSVEDRLQRSGQAISCRIVYCDGLRTRLLFDAMSVYSGRLSRLHLVDFPQRLVDQFSRLNAQYKQLRSLALVFTNWPDRRRSLVFQCPPCLTELSLSWIRVTPATQASIPWTQLIKYCENDCIWAEEEDRWHAYRQLEHAVDFCVQFPAYVDGPEDIVLIPNLQHARLSFRDGAYILKSFDFPCLQILSYDHADARDQGFQMPPSLPHLKILRLRGSGH